MPVRHVMAALILTVALVGCDKVKTSDKDLREVTETAVVEAVDDQSVVLVDVRKPERFAAGHLPNAVNIFLPTIRSGDERLARAKQIIVYGDGWTDALPAAAAKRLIAEGYKEVYIFHGGLEVWKSSGNPVVEGGGEVEQRPETGK